MREIPDSCDFFVGVSRGCVDDNSWQLGTMDGDASKKTCKKNEKGEILKMHGCIEMELYIHRNAIPHIHIFFVYIFTMHPCIIDLYK